MASKKRDQIRMSDEEIARFLDEERVMSVATIGRDGWPHLTALWFVMRDSEPWIYTYAKSQKVKNLEREPRATLMVDSGHDYHELRGVMFKATAELHRDIDTVANLAEQVFRRYQGHTGELGEEMAGILRAQAAKRVAVRFRIRELASWDHSKLGGAY
jgi:PPOX class probable F420-dependent enzyme